MFILLANLKHKAKSGAFCNLCTPFNIYIIHPHQNISAGSLRDEDILAGSRGRPCSPERISSQPREDILAEKAGCGEFAEFSGFSELSEFSELSKPNNLITPQPEFTKAE